MQLTCNQSVVLICVARIQCPFKAARSLKRTQEQAITCQICPFHQLRSISGACSDAFAAPPRRCFARQSLAGRALVKPCERLDPFFPADYPTNRSVHRSPAAMQPLLHEFESCIKVLLSDDNIRKNRLKKRLTSSWKRPLGACHEKDSAANACARRTARGNVRKTQVKKAMKILVVSHF